MLPNFDPQEAARSALLGALLDRQRAKHAMYRAVVLARGLGLTYDAIAGLLDVSEATARRIVQDGSPSIPLIDNAITDAYEVGTARNPRNGKDSGRLLDWMSNPR